MNKKDDKKLLRHPVAHLQHTIFPMKYSLPFEDRKWNQDKCADTGHIQNTI